MICLHRKKLMYASSACGSAGVDIYDRTLALATVACLSYVSHSMTSHELLLWSVLD